MSCKAVKLTIYGNFAQASLVETDNHEKSSEVIEVILTPEAAKMMNSHLEKVLYQYFGNPCSCHK